MASSSEPPPAPGSGATPSPEHYRLLVESLEDYAVFLLDPEGIVRTWNRGATRIKGYAAEEVVGRHFSLFYTPEEQQAEAPRRALEAALAHGRTEQEALRVRKDGSCFWAAVTLTALYDNSHQHIGFSKVTRDITARHQAEVALAEREAQQRELLGAMPDPMLVATRGEIVFCNDRFAQLLKAENYMQLRGARVAEFFHPARRGAVERLLRPKAPTDITAPLLDEEIFRLDRMPVPVDLLATQITYKGEPSTLVVLHNLSIKRSIEEQFALLVERVKDHAIFTLDVQGVVLTWNQGAEAIFGYPAAEVVGQAHYSLFFDPMQRGRQRPQSELDLTRDAGELDVEEWRMRKNGTPFWANIVLTSLRDTFGRHRGFAAMTRDLTERKAAEDSLRAKETYLQSVVDTALDGIITIDTRGRIATFNKAAERVFGYSAAEVCGQNVKILMPEPYAPEHDQYLQNYLESHVPKIIGIGREVKGRRKNGHIFPLELAVAEFRMEGERHFTGIIRDVSARAELEEQLRQSQKMEAFGQLAGGVAHDFNNLLTVITGYSELILTLLGASHPARNYVGILQEAAGKAASLTQQLLAFSRQNVLAPRVLDVNEVVRESETLLRRLIGEDIRLTAVLEPKLGPILADPGHLGQVLMNLAVNARDAMPRGGELTLETRNVTLDGGYAAAHLDAEPGDYVMVAVSDSGHGMPPEVKSRVFEPFFTTKEVGRGTGLGLAVVHGIVKQSGGRIEVYSEEGVGTAFKLYFPRVSEDLLQPRTDARPAWSPGSETILLVEDEEGVRDLVRVALEGQGYTVRAFGNGTEALEFLAGNTLEPDLLITDVVMPRMGGKDLAEQMVARQPTLRVLFLSGYTNDAIVRHGILHQEVDFLEKPFSILSLAQKVREVLDRPQPRRTE